MSRRVVTLTRKEAAELLELVIVEVTRYSLSGVEKLLDRPRYSARLGFAERCPGEAEEVRQNGII